MGFFLFFCRSLNVDIFVEFLAFDEETLDDTVAHLLPHHPDQVPPEQDQAQALPPHLLYTSESEPDSDD